MVRDISPTEVALVARDALPKELFTIHSVIMWMEQYVLNVGAA